MMAPNSRGNRSSDNEQRAAHETGPVGLVGASFRGDDVEPSKGINSVAILFRIMAGMLIVLLALQVGSGLTGAVDLSYGVLFAQAIRLAIGAGLLWGAGDIADLFVKSHNDLRSTRILMERIARLMDPILVAQRTSRAGERDAGHERGDGVQ